MTLSRSFPDRLMALRPELGGGQARVSAAGFGGPGSGSWKAQILSLVGPADRQVLDTNKLIGGQLVRRGLAPPAGGMSARGQLKQLGLLRMPGCEIVGSWMTLLQFLHPRFGHIAG